MDVPTLSSFLRPILQYEILEKLVTFVGGVSNLNPQAKISVWKVQQQISQELSFTGRLYLLHKDTQCDQMWRF